MTSSLWPDSIKTRVTLSALGVFLLSLWILSLLMTRILEQDISQLVADAQASATAQMAAQLDRELGGRLAALAQIAARINAEMIEDPAAVQQLLEEQPLLQDLFNVSVLAVNGAGIGIADVPLMAERIGINYRGRVDAITTALDEGRAHIGRPIIGVSTNQPLIPLAVPIRDFDGRVIGALGGAIDLSKPNFFDDLTMQGYGQTGTYSVISRSQRVIVTSSNTELIMFELPALGVSPLLDRAIEGDEQTYRYTTVQGIDSLTTVKQLESTDWMIATITPISEAFAPIMAAQRRMTLITMLIALLVGAIIWWLLQRQLRPMMSTMEALGQMTESSQPLTSLPLTGGNEINGLIASFNRLLDAVKGREQENERFRTIADNAVYGKSISDLDGNIVYVNRFFAEVHGYSPDELIGSNLSTFHNAAQLQSVEETIGVLRRDGYFSPREIWHVHRSGAEFPMLMSGVLLRDEHGQPQYLASTAVDITDHKQAEVEIHRLAYYDTLTGLPNRRLLQDRVGQAMAGSRRSGHHGALVFLDIDNFKTLNDTRGHDVGDQLLVEIAHRVGNGARESDTVARLGGDEFVVMLEDLSEGDAEAALQARQVAEKIRLALACPYQIDGGDYHCSASLGIALFNGHEASVETLLKHADLAMYKAKDGGRNTMRFFDPAMQTTLDERIALETDLRSALALNQLTVHYQAQIDSDGQVLGAEALLRWIHPERGMVSPARFIPVAEATGLIMPIGHWVLEGACRQLAAWSEHAAMRELRLAVNVSAREFRQADFIDQVRQVLRETGADPARLRMELTESMVLDDLAGTFEKMRILKTLGIGFALDDFGTGHSSLSYLTRLPLDTLKIDRSFVSNLPDSHNDAVVARTIISMASSLGLNVIAEGVETTAQHEFLARHRCQAYQGYLFSRPVPLEEFERYCASMAATKKVV